jgi:hypothetical protein
MSRNPDSEFSDKIDALYKKLEKRRSIKIIFLIFCGVLLAFVLLWAQFRELPNLFLKNNITVKGMKIDLQKKFIVNPRFIGGGQQPYSLMASFARQVSADKVELEKIQGRVTLKDGAILFLLANTGDVQTSGDKIANLYGNVTFIYDKGDTEIWSDTARIDFKNSYIETDDLVQGISMYGKLRGEKGFFIDEKKNFLRLKGPADVIFNSESEEQR